LPGSANVKVSGTKTVLNKGDAATKVGRLNWKNSIKVILSDTRDRKRLD
jgi:hypothetical protein